MPHTNLWIHIIFERKLFYSKTVYNYKIYRAFLTLVNFECLLVKFPLSFRHFNISAINLSQRQLDNCQRLQTREYHRQLPP